MKSPGKKIKLIQHYTKLIVRTYLFLCILIYYVEWYMGEVQQELTFVDGELVQNETRDFVAPVQSLDTVKQKVIKRMTKD